MKEKYILSADTCAQKRDDIMKVSLLYFKQQLKLFFKNKILCVMYGFMCLSTLIGIGIFFSFPAWVFYIFSLMSRFIFYESLLFILMTYIFLSKDRKSHLDETISVAGHHQQYYFFHSILVMLFLLVIYNLLLLFLLLISAMKSNEISMLITLLRKEYLLNILLPQIAAFSMTIIISQIQNRTLSSAILTAVIILLSPYMDLLEWRRQPSIPIDQIVNIIHLPFSIFLQHSNWSIDELYGFQNEIYKIFAIAFWIGSAVISFSLNKMRKNKKIIIAGSLVLTLIFAGIYLPESQLRVDNKWDGHLSDENYYHMMDQKTIYNNEMVDYCIQKYDMNIHITRQLNVSGDLYLTAKQKSQEFILTLYHQYKIKNLSSDKDLTYTRDGDWVYIHFNEPVEVARLQITYSGYHNMLYSNYQAVNLPGFFPWYPMAGKREVYFQNSDIRHSNYGLNPYNKVEEAMFKIDVDTIYPVVCNLEQKDNQFIGKSDSLTLIGGNIDLYGENQCHIVNYFPYVISPYSTLQSEQEWLEKEIQSTKDSFQKIFGIELDVFDNKKIIILPKSISQTQVMGGYVEFNDYILLSSNRSISNEFINYHLYNRFDIEPDFLDLFISSSYLRVDTKEEYVQGILDSIERNIQDLKMYSSENKEETESMVKAMEKSKEHLEKKIKKIGLDETLKEIGQMILGDQYEY